MSNYLEQLRAIKLGIKPKTTGAKEPKPMKKVSDKKAAEMKENKGKPSDLEKWFQAMRKQLVGTCQCGCGRPSSKNDDTHFRASCCHVFPKALFPSVATHPLNCVERNFWDGCHSNMDNRSLDKWPLFADWEDIKERFHVLAPLLTDQERAKKFYQHIERLVYAG